MKFWLFSTKWIHNQEEQKTRAAPEHLFRIDEDCAKVDKASSGWRTKHINIRHNNKRHSDASIEERWVAEPRTFLRANTEKKFYFSLLTTSVPP
jgi:hypothetical protein